ncbi:MAG TPA: hypothetical protein VJT13_06285 [Xanthobacteraceae bacterium]|nr:hypothetical protein [Xanthobacteraceae bacterium]
MAGESRSPGLDALLRYPLLQAINERRTRRVARGVSVLAGDLSHQSANPPQRLEPLEEAILICTTGLTGVVMHDGPLSKPSGAPEDLGTMFVNGPARSAASPDNCQATSLFMINDDGIFLIRRPRGREAATLLDGLPRSWDDWREEDWLRVADAVKVKVQDGRIAFPRSFPYYIGWNKQLSNPPGSTIFVPVVDCTRQYINVMLNLLSEPEGQRPLFVDDWQRFRPRSLKDWGAWAGQYLGLGPKIPYQPIGGVDRATDGFVNPEIPIPLGAAHTLATDHEAFFLMQNLTLAGQALGLGVWGHASIWVQYILQRVPEKGWHGIGFRHLVPKNPKAKAPVPASQHNPVGIDGVLEGLCPPYVTSMDEAVDIVIDEKYGPDGLFSDPALLARAYRKPQDAETYLRLAQRHPPEAIRYVKDICNYIYDTYGRFPAHVDAFHSPGYWVQFHHLETEYYERFFDPQLWRHQAAHDSLWHAREHSKAPASVASFGGNG